MTIYDTKLFDIYVNNPVRIKYMGLNKVVIVGSSTLIASFNSIEKLREYFPYGNYKKLH